MNSSIYPEGKKFIYLGEDEPYFRKLVASIQSQQWGKNVTGELINPRSYEHPNACIKALVGEKTDLFLVDYGRQESAAFNFARTYILAREENKKKVIGLTDHNFKEEQLHRALYSGLTFNFVKGIDLRNLTYTLGHLLYQKLVAPPDNAQVDRINQTVNVLYPGRVIEMTKEYLAVETGAPLIEESTYEIDFRLFPDKDSYNLICTQILRPQKRFDLPNFYLFTTKSVDYPDLDEETEEKDTETYADKIKGKKKIPDVYAEMDKKEEEEKEEEEEEKVLSEHTLEHFLEEYITSKDQTFDKKIKKVLIYDSRFSILNGEFEEGDDLPYKFYYQKTMKQGVEIFDKILPDIIIIMAADISTHILDKYYSFLEAKLSPLKRGRPLLLVFGDKRPVDKLTHLIKYEKMLVRPVRGDHNLITQLLKVHHQKSVDESSKIELPEVPTHYYFEATDSIGLTYVKTKSKVVSLTETIITFTCNEKYHAGTTLKFDWPCHMTVTTICNIRGDEYVRDGAFEYLYTGVINGVGDKGTATVRRKVNEILSKRMSKAV